MKWQKIGDNCVMRKLVPFAKYNRVMKSRRRRWAGRECI
jgi:hypothetical protein